jgi:hypothetical protein
MSGACISSSGSRPCRLLHGGARILQVGGGAAYCGGSVCRKYPEAFARVARGELQLSVLSVLAQYLSSENAAELFDACSRKSCEQVEELLAARFPKPDARDLIRRLPARAEVPPHGGSAGDATQTAGMSAQLIYLEWRPRPCLQRQRHRAPRSGSSSHCRPIALACISRRTRNSGSFWRKCGRSLASAIRRGSPKRDEAWARGLSAGAAEATFWCGP